MKKKCEEKKTRFFTGLVRVCSVSSFKKFTHISLLTLQQQWTSKEPLSRCERKKKRSWIAFLMCWQGKKPLSRPNFFFGEADLACIRNSVKGAYMCWKVFGSTCWASCAFCLLKLRTIDSSLSVDAGCGKHRDVRWCYVELKHPFASFLMEITVAPILTVLLCLQPVLRI